MEGRPKAENGSAECGFPAEAGGRLPLDSHPGVRKSKTFAWCSDLPPLRRHCDSCGCRPLKWPGAARPTGAAADNARAAAETAATCDLERMAVRLVEAKSGVMELVRGVRELPLANGGGMNVRSFPRLMRLADRHGVVETARLRVLATRLGISLPPDHDNSPEARAKWVWQLALLERSVTIRALG